MKRILLVVVLGFLMVPGAWAQVTESSGCADPGPECRAGHYHTLPNGARYEGEVNADAQPHGQGVMTWPDGGRYEGEWKDGRQHGRGVETWPDGHRFEGEFRDGALALPGRGVLTSPDGARYEGDLVEGEGGEAEVHGQGVMTWPDGMRYEGEWSQRAGYEGVMTWADGTRYEGGFWHDQPHGEGVLTWPDGRRIGHDRVWSMGRLFVERFDEDGNGQGVHVTREGWIYEGEFRNGTLKNRRFPPTPRTRSDSRGFAAFSAA